MMWILQIHQRKELQKQWRYMNHSALPNISYKKSTHTRALDEWASEYYICSSSCSIDVVRSKLETYELLLFSYSHCYTCVTNKSEEKWQPNKRQQHQHGVNILSLYTMLNNGNCFRGENIPREGTKEMKGKEKRSKSRKKMWRRRRRRSSWKERKFQLPVRLNYFNVLVIPLLVDRC